MTETAIHSHPGQLPPIVPSMGVCMCGHVGAWHTETPGGQWIRGGPCLVGLCACKAYDYAKVSLASLLHENYVAIWRGENAQERAVTPPWQTGDHDLPDEVYDALEPLDGFPKGSRGGPRIYRYEDWWVCISLSDFGDLFVGPWGLLGSNREGE